MINTDISSSPDFVFPSRFCMSTLPASAFVQNVVPWTSGRSLRCERSPRRPKWFLTAAKPTPPSASLITEKVPDPALEDESIANDAEQCPVYCYVACSPTRSDYLDQVLNSRVYEVLDETPLHVAPLLSARLENTVLLKREDTTPVKSFKLRGAYNMMAKASSESLANGVIAASAGNHAQGVAMAAEKLSVAATIVMPAVTPQIKVDAVRRRGATAILHGNTFDEAQNLALKLAEKDNKLFVPPFDHPDIIAGQATIALELIRQTSNLDAVFVPVGGGGLIAGIACIVKRLRPETAVIGVEPYDAAAMHNSLLAQKRIRLKRIGTFADGVAVAEVGRETFRLCGELVDEVILVSTDEICAAIKDVFEDTRSILEPAGALAVAGVKAFVQREKVTGKKFAAIASGANTNFDNLRHISERAEIGEGREGILAVTIPERPGSFRELINALGGNLSITEFNYRYNGSIDAHVFVGAKIAVRNEVKAIMDTLGSAGYESYNLTDNEMAKLHIRHLVGGNAMAREKVFRFEFPERPGALKKFLDQLPSAFNITMFHYRNHGADVGRVLVGLTSVKDIDDAFDIEELETFVTRLGYEYTREDGNVAYKFFLGKKA
ncbi:L-threonine dehydratase biosynthetic IlvA [Gracilariopsis chorda]|uniref:Threonine dehydratase n=1 Tax=Gracilariopsis chorda TaxID=448386 RepID=A0A2V3IZ09_9FLOR|nr:L-threonine dehydratase biosynthetic IlvA [Gracilariopsis chorda]|eukprot:PXF47396.1 L-threonine dehydratase biosynthetic IlvA [Gracilariopsis chorda]